MNLYSDSIVDEPYQVLNSDNPQRSENQDQKQLSVSNGPFHCSFSPHIKEFSELIQKVSTKVLKYTLLTNQQRLFAEAMWEAQNYGGSESKCIKRLQELYGSQWRSITKLSDHMEPVRPYYEMVLLLDHERQWADTTKTVKLHEQQDNK
jgi:hypothetical protein